MFIPKGYEKKLTQNPGVFRMTLPIPISHNDMYCPGDRKIMLTQKARGYYAEMYQLLEHETYKTMTGRLAVSIILHEPDKRRRDINNITKSLFDALERCEVFKDDSQIDECIIKRGQIKRAGCIKIVIKQVAEEDERLTISEQDTIINNEKTENEKNKLLKGLVKGKNNKNKIPGVIKNGRFSRNVKKV